MENGVDRARAQGTGSARAWAKDALGAVTLAETRTCDRVLASGVELRTDGVHSNAFGTPVVIEHGDAPALAARLEAYAADGERVAMIADASSLASARATFRAIAHRGLPAVVHAMAPCARDRGADGEALALADLGWGILFASCVEDSLDMALVARRAAEDCGTPFFVVHEAHGNARHVEPVAPPSVELCEVFVGTPASRVKKVSDASHPIHADISERAFAERVPFALGSAMRELEALTGRRHDVIERIPATDTQVTLLAMGELGESLIGAVEAMRARGVDVGAVRLTAFRPFPGARLVKILSRALAVSVIESINQPLAQSNPITRELKAAFADALTWAPDYPGVGRIPRIVSGVAYSGAHEISTEDVEAIVHNMLSPDDRGKRSFVLGAAAEHGLAPAPDASLPVATAPARTFSMRGRVRDAETAEACAELCASVLNSALGLRARASVRPIEGAEGDGFAVDVVASRDRPRGAHAPHVIRVVALEDAGSSVRGNPLARLAEAGIIVVPTQQRSADGVWSELPPYAKAIVFDRRARVVGYAPPVHGALSAEEAAWMTAATFAGLALASLSAPGRPAIDASLVAREVAEVLRVALGVAHEGLARRGGDAARAVFEGHVEVPRATVERDEESVRLGRRDARSGAGVGGKAAR